MARIAGVNLPREKRLEVALTYIFGIGRSTARRIAAELGLSLDTKVSDLTDGEITKLRDYIASHPFKTVVGDVKFSGSGYNVAATGESIVQFQNGSRVVVFPKAVATGSLVYPRTAG